MRENKQAAKPLDWSSAWATSNTPWVHGKADSALLKLRPKLRKLGLKAGDEVFVPLCGKSKALKLLHQWGYSVRGLEFVRKPILLFFKERFPRRKFNRQKVPYGVEYSLPRLSILEMDIFKYREKERYSFVYDRGALVAVEPKNQKRYAKLIARSVKPGGLILILTRTARRGKLIGPPFPISSAKLRKLFPGFTVELQKHTDLKIIPERFLAQGITAMTESYTLLRKKT